jgi:hypothetical protein
VCNPSHLVLDRALFAVSTSSLPPPSSFCIPCVL